MKGEGDEEGDEGFWSKKNFLTNMTIWGYRMRLLGVDFCLLYHSNCVRNHTKNMEFEEDEDEDELEKNRTNRTFVFTNIFDISRLVR